MKELPRLPPTQRSNLYRVLLALVVGLIVATWIRDWSSSLGLRDTISYSQFVQSLSEGKVADVSLGRETVQGTFRAAPQQKTRSFIAVRPDDPDLIKRLIETKTPFTAIPESRFLANFFVWFFPLILMFFLWRSTLGRTGAGGAMLGMGRSGARVFSEKDIQVKFEDVAGVEEAKAELQEVVQFLKDPERFGRLGGRMPKGILLVGPPGTGKTLLARAVAGEASVPFFSINGSEFVELFVGLGAARVRDLFAQARSSAPCILFIDELDALGKARGVSVITGTANDEKEQTLNQLLAEIDGFDPSRGVVLLAATNRPEILDPALLRSGRFDRQVLLDRPDKKGRNEILKVHLKKVSLSKDANVDEVAGLTAGFSGADLANLVNEAALGATRRNAPSIEQKDLVEAFERVVAGVERRSRVLSQDEKRRVAFHEMGHAILALSLGQFEAVQKVSVIPRGLGALGYTLRRPTEDRYLFSKEELENKLIVLLGGRASEQLFLGNVSTGAADDFAKATDIARSMITQYGMSHNLGVATLEEPQVSFLGGEQAPSWTKRSFSEETARAIDTETRSILEKSLNRSVEVLKKYRSTIEEGVKMLMLQETLDEKQLKGLMKTAPCSDAAFRIGSGNVQSLEIQKSS